MQQDFVQTDLEFSKTSLEGGVFSLDSNGRNFSLSYGGFWNNPVQAMGNVLRQFRTLSPVGGSIG